MATTKQFTISENISLEYIVASIIRFLREDKKMVSEVILKPQGFFLQSKSKEQLKSLIGMSLATQIQFEICDNRLRVNIGSGKWVDKIAVFVVSFLHPIGAVTLATAAYGAWQQKKLSDEILEKIQEIIQRGNCIANEKDYKFIFQSVAGEDICAYAEKCEDKKKIMLLKIAAEGKSACAAVELGKLYYYGKGVPKDLSKAAEYWKNCSQNLDAETSLLFADMYRDGNGIEKNLKKAFALYKKSPANYADSRITDIFEQGTDLPEYGKFVVPKYVKRFEAGETQLLDKIIEIYTKLNDSDKLQKWQIVKAKNGDIDLALELGKNLYEEGNAKSVELLEIAAQKEDPVALRMLGEAYWNGDLVQEDDEKAISLLQKAAQKGSLNAAEILVIHYDEYDEDDVKLLKALEQEIALFESGKYVDKDEDFSLADELYELAWLYCSGGEDGEIPRNVSKGIDLFLKAIELGDSDSYLSLAEIYSEEEYGTVDYDKAIAYCKKAVDANVEDAQTLLSDLQEKRDAPKQKDEFEHLKKIYKDDKTGGLTVKLAKMYACGKGTAPNRNSAVKLFREAYRLGNAEAAYYLGQMEESSPWDISEVLRLYKFSVEHGFEPAQSAVDLLEQKLKKFYNRLVGPYLDKHKRNINDEADLEKLSSTERNAYLRYFIHMSYEAAEIYFDTQKQTSGKLPYWSKMHINYCDHIDGLSVAFLEAYHQTKNPEAANHFFKKLVRLDVYWPLLLLFKKISSEAVSEDNYEKHLLACILLETCAEHGCIEAVVLHRRIMEENSRYAEILNQLDNIVPKQKREDAIRYGVIQFFESMK